MLHARVWGLRLSGAGVAPWAAWQLYSHLPDGVTEGQRRIVIHGYCSGDWESGLNEKAYAYHVQDPEFEHHMFPLNASRTSWCKPGTLYPLP